MLVPINMHSMFLISSIIVGFVNGLPQPQYYSKTAKSTVAVSLWFNWFLSCLPYAESTLLVRIRWWNDTNPCDMDVEARHSTEWDHSEFELNGVFPFNRKKKNSVLNAFFFSNGWNVMKFTLSVNEHQTITHLSSFIHSSTHYTIDTNYS